MSTVLGMHGPEAALRALTPIREDRTQQGKCFVFSSSIRSQKIRPLSRGRSRDVDVAYWPLADLPIVSAHVAIRTKANPVLTRPFGP